MRRLHAESVKASVDPGIETDRSLNVLCFFSVVCAPMFRPVLPLVKIQQPRSGTAGEVYRILECRS